MGFRYSDPTKDKDLYGNPIQEGYCIFVRKKDCQICHEGDKTYYNPNEAKAIPVVYSNTYCGFSEWKRESSTIGIKIDDKIVYDYWHCTAYFAHNGYVYTGSINKKIE